MKKHISPMSNQRHRKRAKRPSTFASGTIFSYRSSYLYATQQAGHQFDQRCTCMHDSVNLRNFSLLTIRHATWCTLYSSAVALASSDCRVSVPVLSQVTMSESTRGSQMPVALCGFTSMSTKHPSSISCDSAICLVSSMLAE